MTLRITYRNPFKSIVALDSIDIPRLTVITGLNGSGKTHLLQAISASTQNKNARYIELTEDNEIIEDIKFSNLNSIQQRGSTARYHQLQQEIHHYGDILERKNGVGSIDEKTNKLFTFIAIKAKKSREEITRADLEFHLPTVMPGEVPDLFDHQFGRIFTRYNARYSDNEYRRMLAEKTNKEYQTTLSEEDFFQKFGHPPWDLANSVFSSAGLKYTINRPPPGLVETSFSIKLRSIDESVEIDLEDLSSGERLLMSVGMALYNSEYEENSFPKVLLLDEPDAHLHPSMTKQLLKVLQEVFIDKKGLHVVLTTHSPSTVALAPDDSIYVMRKLGPSRLDRASKDRAISLLTSGVPTLSVRHENRRQVFVEGSHDEIVYDRIFNILQKEDKLSSDISLCFISSGSGGSGSRQQTQDIVKTLREAGNTSIFGIVDWDKTDTTQDGIFVLAKNLRYTLENVVLDPLLIGALLLREKIPIVSFHAISYVDFSKHTQSYQSIADEVIARLSKQGSADSSDTIRSRYLGGDEITIPKWYAEMNGHRLEELIFESFPHLNRIAKRKQDLKNEIINRIFDDFPTLIPIDFIELFQKILCF